MVFPAYAGMSPEAGASSLLSQCFPRLRGDEPITQAVARDVLGFSPPTRG